MSFRNTAAADPAEEYNGGSRKRQRPQDMHAAPLGAEDGGFQQEDGEDDEDEDDEEKSKDKKAGRRKIKIEFIQDKSRRHITFSKRKAGIMKKAYELSTLTGTQVLLLVVSETGLVYTFTTAKLQPLVTQPEGKNLIQACLNAPHGQLPSSMPVGTPIGRSASGPAGTSGGGGGHSRSGSQSSAPPPHGMSIPGTNVVGGLSIGGGGKDSEDGDEDEGTESASPVMSAASANKRGGAVEPPATNASSRPRRGAAGGAPPPPATQRKSTGGSPPQPAASVGNHGAGDIQLQSPSLSSPQTNSQQNQAGSGGYAPHGHHSAQGGYGNQQSSPMMHSAPGSGSQGGLPPPGDAYTHASMMQPYHMPQHHQGGQPGGAMHAAQTHWGAVPQPGSYHRR